jgi:hypothetical protein
MSVNRLQYQFGVSSILPHETMRDAVVDVAMELMNDDQLLEHGSVPIAEFVGNLFSYVDGHEGDSRILAVAEDKAELEGIDTAKALSVAANGLLRRYAEAITAASGTGESPEQGSVSAGAAQEEFLTAYKMLRRILPEFEYGLYCRAKKLADDQ